QAKVRMLLNRVQSAGRTLLMEHEAKEVLACYGIPTVRTLTARSADEAVARARELGYPVVVKLWSETITHKSDAGGVRLNLADDAAVRTAFAQVRENSQRYGQEHGLESETFRGITVQPMVGMKGYELIVGSSVDVQ